MTFDAFVVAMHRVTKRILQLMLSRCQCSPFRYSFSGNFGLGEPFEYRISKNDDEMKMKMEMKLLLIY